LTAKNIFIFFPSYVRISGDLKNTRVGSNDADLHENVAFGMRSACCNVTEQRMQLQNCVLHCVDMFAKQVSDNERKTIMQQKLKLKYPAFAS
jgi:hypothetical protein